MRNELLRMHPNEKRATQNKRLHSALLSYAAMGRLTGGRNKYLHGCQWMSEKNVQQE